MMPDDAGHCPNHESFTDKFTARSISLWVLNKITQTQLLDESSNNQLQICLDKFCLKLIQI